MSKMERARAQISILGVVSLLVITALMIWQPTEEASGKAALFASGPPGINVSHIDIFAPVTGSRVTVKTGVSAFTNATDGVTEIMVKDLTSGAESAWTDYSDSKALSIKFSGGGYGDLIEVWARNGSEEASAVVGTVPAPTDSAPPDLVESSFTTSGTTTLQVNWTAGSIKDGSFPATATLSVVGGATSSPVTIVGDGAGANLLGGSVSVTATNDDRVVLTIEDDYGNRTLLEFIKGQSILNAGWTSGTSIFHAKSSTQADSEIAGTAGIISAGDSGAGITVWGQELLYSVTPYTAKAPIIDLAISLSHRTGIAKGGAEFDGPVGKGFDWNLDARIEDGPGSDYYWYPGDGRRIGPFTYDRQGASLRYWDSPEGVFLQLTLDTAAGELYLTNASEFRWVFDSTTGMLIRMEDYYAHGASPAPSDPDLNKITLVRDDDEKVVRAILGNGQIVRFGWFHHDRLASIHHQRPQCLPNLHR